MSNETLITPEARLRNVTHAVQSQTLTLLQASPDCGFVKGLELLTEFIEREYAETSCLEILCDWFERNRRSAWIREECEELLRDGISEERHSDLEERFWMSPRVLEWNIYNRDVQHFYESQLEDRRNDADPAKERPWLGTCLVKLPPSEWATTLDCDELVCPQEEEEYVKEWRMPRPGSPTDLSGMSGYDSLDAVRNAGVLSVDAIYGFVAWVLDCDYNLGAMKVLCEHIDSQGHHERFAEYFSQRDTAAGRC